MTRFERQLPDAAATEAFGARLAACCKTGLLVCLRGELGAGKTTLVRGMLRGLGHTGAVKSPTYTLVESYRFDGLAVHHLDLYRLGDPGELEWLGIRDLLGDGALCLVEWPERGAGVLPPPDLELQLDYRGEGRHLVAHARDERGVEILRCLQQAC
jgi:tRNA threonylcarbamoyladenosine biosynthesis protein TsaE